MIKLVTCIETKFGQTSKLLCLQYEDYKNHLDDFDGPIQILFVGNEVHDIPWTDRETLVTSIAGWRLASALYDCREQGLIEDVAEVELPDGTLFIIDEELP
jgi:hypothetical protein